MATGRLLEVSWEVCNKVGGIHTVITSKLPYSLHQFGEGYLGVGPDVGQGAPLFIEAPRPPHLEAVAGALAASDVLFRYGHWNVEGTPAVILVSWDKLSYHLNDLKASYWNQFKLDTLGTDYYDVDTPLLWATAVGMIARALALHDPSPLTLHLHEWMAGAGVLPLQKDCPTNLRTVFTTHATVLGRALSSRGVDITTLPSSLNADGEARRMGVLAKHQIEALSATRATVFTTVSTTTQKEAALFLGRTAEVVTENGVDLRTLPDMLRIGEQRTFARAALDRFIAQRFPDHSIDPSHTTYTFTMGRYEVRNKGYDTFIAGLGSVNEQLKAEQSSETVIGLILVPGDAAEALPVGEHQYSTHRLRQGDNEAVVVLAREHGLHNLPEDKVKLIFVPVYLEGHDGIFNLPLYELIVGCDLGVFASRYEPWGYTPMECLAVGVPGITSQCAGFGVALEERNLAPSPACAIISSADAQSGTGAKNVAERILQTITLDTREQAREQIAAYLAAEAFSWENLYSLYEETYALAWK